MTFSKINKALQQKYIVDACQEWSKKNLRRVSDKVLELVMNRSETHPYERKEQVLMIIETQMALEPEQKPASRRRRPIHSLRDLYAEFIGWILGPLLKPLIRDLHDRLKILEVTSLTTDNCKIDREGRVTYGTTTPHGDVQGEMGEGKA